MAVGALTREKTAFDARRALERVLSWPVVALLVTAVLVVRCADFLLHPVLRVEDGPRVFAYFYAHRGLEYLLRSKGGYIPLLPNLFGFIAVRLPITWAPYFLTWAPLAEAAIGFSLFQLKAFRRHVPSDTLRFAICLAMVVNPVGQFHLVCNTDFSIWTSLFILMLLALIPLPAHAAPRALVWCAANLLVWTNPLSIFVLPLHVLWAVRQRGAGVRALHAALVVSQVAHVIWGVESTNAVHELLHWDFWQAVLTRTSAHVRDWTFLSIFGLEGLRSVKEAASWLPALVTLVLVAALIWIATRRSDRVASRELLAAIPYFVVAPIVLVVMSKSEAAMKDEPRYHYVSALICTLAFVLVVFQVAKTSLGRVVRGPARIEWVSAFGTLLYFLHIANDNTGRYTNTHPENGPVIARCFEELDEQERQHHGHCGVHVVCRKHHDWSFTIDTRRSCVP